MAEERTIVNAGRNRAARLAAYGAVSTSLALLGDRALGELLDAAAEPGGVGIGGRSARLAVAGVPVFVKRVPLTDLELLPQHRHSTANLFGVPANCHYGVGFGPGFGAWRELAAHTMTTNWVLTGAYAGFPLMYHWRVLPDPAAGVLPAELADVERAVAHWGGSRAVRRRIEALGRSATSLVVFMEYVPDTLHDWLGKQVRAGEDAANRACALVERELAAGTSFMNARGLLHLDAHFRNILTDGHRLYFADFGLALADRFELAPPEAAFFERHRDYDGYLTRSWLLNRLVTEVYGHERPAREALIRACAAGAEPPPGPRAARSLLAREAPLAAVMTDFYGRLLDESREIPYPVAALAALGPLGRVPLRPDRGPGQ